MRLVPWAGLSLMMGLGAGCSATGMVMSGGRMAARVIVGAEAKIIPLKDLAGTAAKDYRVIRLGDVTTDVPTLVPVDKLGVIRTEMELKLGEESTKAFPEGGKALIANVAVRFLKERGKFGGQARLDMIATLADADSHEEIARLFIEGISDSPTAGKTDDMAKENAKELVRYLVKKQKGEKAE